MPHLTAKHTRIVAAVMCAVLIGSVVVWHAMARSAVGQMSISADYTRYDSLEDAHDASDVIVVASVVDSRVELLPPGAVKASRGSTGRGVSTSADTGARLVATVHRVQVSDVVHGSTVRGGDIIEVSQIGGFHNGVTYQDASTTLLTELGHQVVLLLETTSEDMYTPINPIEGVFEERGGLLVPVNESVAPDFRGMTVDFLSHHLCVAAFGCRAKTLGYSCAAFCSVPAT
ncbi:hypothetical protein [Jonesia quinghaiensis]|uniref:hypothetical protein n=1 Tax=Jonesia quinghaiensis TaxID=262806 RepID=UPI0004117206|nr:hypothetical protein [Jonesia quinghaiensis]